MKKFRLLLLSLTLVAVIVLVVQAPPFPGSPVELKHAFRVEGDKIAGLVIA